MEPTTDPREQADPERESRRLCALVSQMEEGYKRHRAFTDVRNLAYYRGNFWDNDVQGVPGIESLRDYTSQRNETFPIIDSIVSSLAMELPQVEAIDQRALSYATPARARSSTQVGRRIASAMNWFADQDEMARLVHELVLLAEIFDAGGCVKTYWSPTTSRVAWRAKLPWEVHFDPSAKRVQDAAWSFERFVLHFDDFQDRIRSDLYERPKKQVQADTYPRDLISDTLRFDEESEIRRQGLREYIGLVEFWDYRKGLLYHLHPDSRTVLSKTKMPYSRPYEVLVFHSGVGRMRGVSDVSYMAPVQRDINELTAARREIVNRLPARVLMDRKLFASDEDFADFCNSRSWEPKLIDMPADGASFEGRVVKTPNMDTTFDFNTAAKEGVDHIRYVGGAGDYKRGAIKNIRTAAEVDAVTGADDERLQVRARRLGEVVKSMFTRGLEAFRWAVANPDVSGIDIVSIHEATQADIDVATFQNEILTQTPAFRLLPFSPAMEDKNVRRGNLVELMGMVAGNPMAAAEVNWRSVLREVFDGFNMPPECLRAEVPPPARVPEPEPEPMQAAPASPVPGGPMGGPPAGLDPQQLMAAMAAGQQPPGSPGMVP